MVENGNLKVVLPEKPKAIENGNDQQIDSDKTYDNLKNSIVNSTEMVEERNQKPKSMIEQINSSNEPVLEPVDEQQQNDVINENDIIDDIIDEVEYQSNSESDTELVNIKIVRDQ